MSMFLILPALFALALKLLILSQAFRRNSVSTTFLSLIIVFACHNAIELIAYSRFLDDQAVSALLRGYYIATVTMLMFIVLHACNIAKIYNKLILGGLLAVSFLLSGMILFSDLIVAGSESIGYAPTAEKGAYFPLFGLYVVLALLAPIFVLWRRFTSAKNQQGETQALYTLFALLPIIVVCALGISLKVADAHYNLMGLIPLATTLFLYILLKGESNHRLTDLRRFLPFSRERQASQEFLRLIDEYAQRENGHESYNTLRVGFERQVILYTLDKTGNNITKAAEMMGLANRSTLYSMMKRLEISIRDSQASIK